MQRRTLFSIVGAVMMLLVLHVTLISPELASMGSRKPVAGGKSALHSLFSKSATGARLSVDDSLDLAQDVSRKDDASAERDSTLNSKNSSTSLIAPDSERSQCAESQLHETRADRKTGFITFTEFANYGRLGNQLFQYAALLGLAKYHGVEAKLPRRWWERSTQGQQSLMRNFKITMGELDPTDECCVTRYEEKEINRFGFDASLLTAPLPIDLKGYFLSLKYHCNIMEEIRSEYRLQDPIRDRALASLATVKAGFVAKGTAGKDSIFVGVHIRRGDILQQQYWFNTPTATYIHAAMKWYQERHTQPIFIVTSGGNYHKDLSDKEWCRRELVGENIHISENEDDFDDFALLASCDHAIYTSGTFGWWSAFLAGGSVVAWPHWQKQTWYEGHEADFFPSSWVMLDVK